MKRITLVKIIDHVQVGHLYEHLYCMQLTDALRSKGLFWYVDYHVVAKTYYSGFIYIEISLYTDKAIAEISTLYNIQAERTEESIQGALSQIMAEKFTAIKSIDYSFVIDEISKYQSEKWLSINDLGSVDARSRRKKIKGFELIERSDRNFMVIYQEVAIDREFIQSRPDVYAPLFSVVAAALTNNLQDVIANSSYCYSHSDDFVETNGCMKLVNRYHIDRCQATRLTAEAKVAESLIVDMLSHNFIGKLNNFLQEATYDKSQLAPNPELVAQDTGMIVGASGWKDIGTEANIRLVLEQIKVDFRLADSRQGLALKSLM